MGAESGTEMVVGAIKNLSDIEKEILNIQNKAIVRAL
jgi:hypothetical protein